MRPIDYDRLEEYAMKYQERNPKNPLTRNDFKLINNFLFECTLMNDISITPIVQEPVRPGLGIIHNDDGSKSYFLHCPLDGTMLDDSDNYCRHCGRKMKWK